MSALVDLIVVISTSGWSPRFHRKHSDRVPEPERAAGREIESLCFTHLHRLLFFALLLYVCTPADSRSRVRSQSIFVSSLRQLNASRDISRFGERVSLSCDPDIERR